MVVRVVPRVEVRRRVQNLWMNRAKPVENLRVRKKRSPQFTV